MLKMVTVAEARHKQVNNLDEFSCKAYVLFSIHQKEDHLAYLYDLHLSLINLKALTFTKPQKGPTTTAFTTESSLFNHFLRPKGFPCMLSNHTSTEITERPILP